jgi:hypothetical protein
MCNSAVILSFPKIKFTVWSRVLLEKLIVAQLITTTNVHYHSHSNRLMDQTLSLMNQFHTLMPCFTYILNISSYLRLSFLSVVVFQVSRINFYVWVSSRILASIYLLWFYMFYKCQKWSFLREVYLCTRLVYPFLLLFKDRVVSIGCKTYYCSKTNVDWMV